jgi:hypothetical protein
MTVLLKVTEYAGTLDRSTGTFSPTGQAVHFGHVIPAAHRRPATGFVDEAWTLADGAFGEGAPVDKTAKHVFTAEVPPTPVNLGPVRIFAPGDAVARFAGEANLASLVQIGAGTFEFFVRGPGPDHFSFAGFAFRAEADPWEYWTNLPDLQPGTEIVMVKVGDGPPDPRPDNVFAVLHALNGAQPPG